jgi:hypothetical protein
MKTSEDFRWRANGRMTPKAMPSNRRFVPSVAADSATWPEVRQLEREVPELLSLFSFPASV